MKKIVKNTAILTAITLVAGCLLGLVYEITKEPIAVAKENAKQEAYRAVLTDAKEFEEYDKFDADAAAKLVADAGYTDDITEVAVAKDEAGESMGFVVSVTSHDGILNDGTVKGIEMLEIAETAGLGMKADEPEFKEQFVDKKVEKFSYTKTGEEGDDKIDALSGATITTNAVTNAVDAALVYFQNELGGSVNE